MTLTDRLRHQCLDQVVGGTGTCGPFNTIELNNLTPLHAVLWQNGKPTDLGNLGGDGKSFGIFATGVNDYGQVVGVSDTTGDASFHGFLWQRGHITDLGTLKGDANSLALAIGNNGLVLGVSLDANFQPAGGAVAQWHADRPEYSRAGKLHFGPADRMLHQRQRRDHRIRGFEEQSQRISRLPGEAGELRTLSAPESIGWRQGDMGGIRGHGTYPSQWPHATSNSLKAFQHSR